MTTLRHECALRHQTPDVGAQVTTLSASSTVKVEEELHLSSHVDVCCCDKSELEVIPRAPPNGAASLQPFELLADLSAPDMAVVEGC